LIIHAGSVGLALCGQRTPGAGKDGSEHIITQGGVVRLTIDTETDTYEQAVAAVQIAYGLRPAVPADWPDAPPAERRPGPEDLSEDDLEEGWTDRMLFEAIASLMPGARAVLRRIVDLGGTASYDAVQQYFADHLTHPIPATKIGGTLTSIRAVQRRVGPAGAQQLLLLQRAFVLADLRLDLLRR
jgi:hypothetical protein